MVMAVVVVVMVVMGVRIPACGDPVAAVLEAMSMVSSAEEWYPAIIHRIIDGTTLKTPIPPLSVRI